jgi:hypothetical protein
VFLDSNGNIIGVSYTTPKMTIAYECDSSKVRDGIFVLSGGFFLL